VLICFVFRNCGLYMSVTNQGMFTLKSVPYVLVHTYAQTSVFCVSNLAISKNKTDSEKPFMSE